MNSIMMILTFFLFVGTMAYYDSYGTKNGHRCQADGGMCGECRGMGCPSSGYVDCCGHNSQCIGGYCQIVPDYF